MMRWGSIALASLLGLTAMPAGAVNGNLSLTFDPSGWVLCGLDIPCECSGRMYVYALLQGASAQGITGAEYKIAVGPNSNADPGWLMFETFEPGAIVLGSALTPADPLRRGVNVAWNSCQTGDGIKVLIQTVNILNVGCSTSTLEFKGVKHDTASNAHFQCPLFTLCDGPVYTKVCLGFNLTLCQNPNPPFPYDAICSTSGVGWVNPPAWEPRCGFPVDCKVAVDGETWTGVKSLYR